MSLTITPVASTGTSPATTQQSPSFKGGVTSEVVDEFIKRGNPVKTIVGRNFVRGGLLYGILNWSLLTIQNVSHSLHAIPEGFLSHGGLHSTVAAAVTGAITAIFVRGVKAYNKLGAKKGLELARELKAAGADESKLRIMLDNYLDRTRCFFTKGSSKRNIIIQDILDKLNGSAAAQVA